MKKGLSIFVLALSLSALYAQQTIKLENGRSIILRDNKTWEYLDSLITSFDFRNIKWNSTKEDAQKAESGKLSVLKDNPNVLFRTDTLLATDAYVYFYYNQKGLYKGAYIFRNPIEFSEYYNVLESKYGSPIDNYSNITTKTATWETETTKITLYVKDFIYEGKRIWECSITYEMRNLPSQELSTGKF